MPRRARTPEQAESILGNLAYKLAEEKLRNGTASSQLICQILQNNTAKKKLEEAKLRNEALLAEAKVEQIRQGARSEELYARVLRAFKKYTGAEDYDPDEVFDEEDEDW